MDKLLFDSDAVSAAIKAMARQMCEAFPGKSLVLVGIHNLGVPLAELLAVEIAKLCGDKMPGLGKLDISMYRDDIGDKTKRLPVIQETSIPFDINGADIILVDDVLSTGRTIRAALDALTDFGRPHMIRLAVLVDRGNPEYPIRADFTGFSVNVSENRRITVQIAGFNAESSGVWEADWNKSK